MIAEALRNLEMVFSWIWDASWQASVLALLVLTLQRTLGSRLNPRWRYALWLLVLVRLVLPALPESALSLFQFAPPPPSSFIAPVTEPLFVMAPVSAEQMDLPPIESAYPFSIFTLLALIWLTGATVLLLLTWQINHRFGKQIAHSPQITDPELLNLFAMAKAELGVRRPIRLVENGQVQSPAVMGLFQPTLLLPAHARDKFDDRELRFIFLHELAHLKRGDVITQGLIALLQIVHWFNPVLWFVFRRMRIDREPATDAMVLSRTGEDEKERYGMTLIKLLEHFNQRHSLPTLVGILEDKDQFKRRFSLIAKFTRGAYGWSLLGILLISVLAVACLTKSKTNAPAKLNAEPAGKSPDADVVTTVNGKPVPGWLINYWRLTPPSTDMEKTVALQRVIDDELMVQAADASDLSYAEIHLQERLDFAIKGFGGDKSAFIENLKKNGQTLEQFIEASRRQEIVSHFIAIHFYGPAQSYADSHLPPHSLSAEEAAKQTNKTIQTKSAEFESTWLTEAHAKAKIQTFGGTVPGPVIIAASDPTKKLNDLRLENLKVKDMPLDQFVKKIHDELLQQDPEKQGIHFVLDIPPGEQPIPVSLDFTKIPGYRANASMILGPIKAHYPVRIRYAGDSILIQQLSKDEIAFNKKALATLIDVDFKQANVVDALKSVQVASATKGFTFDLDLKAVSQPGAIDLKASQVSVDQALRSIFYLSDLSPKPLDHFTGYAIYPLSPDSAKNQIYISLGSEVVSYRVGTDDQKQFRESLKKQTTWWGPSTHGRAYGADGRQMGDMGMERKVPGPNGEIEQLSTVNATLIDKTHLRVTSSLEIKDSNGKSAGKISGTTMVASGSRALLFSPDSAPLSIPGKASDPATAFAGVMQVTLQNEDEQPLLPPPSSGTVELPISTATTSGPATSVDDDADLTGKVPINHALDDKLIYFARWAGTDRVGSGDADKVRELLEQGADPNAKDKSGNSALEYALNFGKDDAAKWLVRYGADGAAVDNTGENRAWLAAKIYYCPKSLELLLKKGVKITGQNKQGRTIIQSMMSAVQAHPDQMNYLRDRDWTDAEYQAWLERQRRTFDLLCSAGVDINGQDGAETPLTRAVTDGNTGMVRLLIARGANPLVKNESGETAISLAQKLHPDLVPILEKTDKGETTTISPISSATATLAQVSTGATPSPQGQAGGAMINLTIHTLQVSEAEYQAHRSDIDAAVQKGDYASISALHLQTHDLFQQSTILTKSGEQCVLECVRVFPYPVAFEKGPDGKMVGTDFKRKNVGARFVSKPELKDGKIVITGTLNVSNPSGMTQQPNYPDVPVFHERLAPISESFEIGQTKGFEAPGGAEPAPLNPMEGLGPDKLPLPAQDAQTPRRIFFFLTAAACDTDGHPIPAKASTAQQGNVMTAVTPAQNDFQAEEDSKTPLMKTLESHDYKTAQTLVDQGADLSATDKVGNNALACLILHASTDHPLPLDLLESILKRSSNANPDLHAEHATPPYSDPTLNIAILDNSFAENPDHHANERKVVQMLLDHGAQFSGVTDKNVQTLLAAAARGDLKALQQTIKAGASIDAADSTGWNALTIAISMGYDDCAIWLIDNGANVSAKARNGWDSPLRLAVQRQQDDLVEKLVAHGAKADITDGGLSNAIDRKDQRLFDNLIKAGADPTKAGWSSTGSKNERSPETELLYQCIQTNQTAMAKTLLERGAAAEPPRLRNNMNFVYWAVYYNRPEILQALLDHGANASLQPDLGDPALTLAQKKHPELVPILEKAGKSTTSVPATTPDSLPASSIPKDAIGLLITGEAINMKQKVLQNDKDKVRLQVEREAVVGPTTYSQEPSPKNVITIFTDSNNFSSPSSPRLTLTYTYKMVDDTSVLIDAVAERINDHGGTVGKVAGQWTQKLNTEVRLAVHGFLTFANPRPIQFPAVGDEMDDGYDFMVKVEALKIPGGAPLTPPNHRITDVEMTTVGNKKDTGETGQAL